MGVVTDQKPTQNHVHRANEEPAPSIFTSEASDRKREYKRRRGKQYREEKKRATIFYQRYASRIRRAKHTTLQSHAPSCNTDTKKSQLPPTNNEHNTHSIIGLGERKRRGETGHILKLLSIENSSVPSPAFQATIDNMIRKMKIVTEYRIFSLVKSPKGRLN